MVCPIQCSSLWFGTSWHSSTNVYKTETFGSSPEFLQRSSGSSECGIVAVETVIAKEEGVGRNRLQ